MAEANFRACLAETLKHEGGWSDHPSDPGGATMKGITIGRFREYHPNATKEDLRSISDSEVEHIYLMDYWMPVRGDSLPWGVDLAVFDFGVNSGPARSARYLQSIVGAEQDGKIGSITLGLVNDHDEVTIIKKLCAKRLSFVQGLSTFAVFGRGWSRRIADIEARAVAMFLARGGEVTQSVKRRLKDEADAASETARARQGQAGGAAAGGGTMAGGDAVVSGDPNWWLIAGVVIVVAALAGALILKARQNRERAEAYAAVAAA